jgi:hypothetical protein
MKIWSKKDPPLTHRMFDIYSFATSPMGKGIASALISYTAHYTTVKAYSEFCVPTGIQGFLQGLVSTGSPVCQVGVQAMSATQVSYTTVIMMGISRILLDAICPGLPATEKAD